MEKIRLHEGRESNQAKGGKNDGSHNLPERSIQEQGLISHDDGNDIKSLGNLPGRKGTAHWICPGYAGRGKGCHGHRRCNIGRLYQKTIIWAVVGSLIPRTERPDR